MRNKQLEPKGINRKDRSTEKLNPLQTDVSQFSLFSKYVDQYQNSYELDVSIPQIKIHFLRGFNESFDQKDKSQAFMRTQKKKSYQTNPNQYQNTQNTSFLNINNSQVFDLQDNQKSNNQIHKQQNQPITQSNISRIYVKNDKKCKQSANQQFITFQNFNKLNMQCFKFNYQALKLSVTIMQNRIKKIKRKKYAKKLIQYLKINTLIYKVNFIIKLNAFFNIQNSFTLIKHSQRKTQITNSFQKMEKIARRKQKLQIFIAFSRFKLFKSSFLQSPYSLISFSITLKNVLMKKIHISYNLFVQNLKKQHMKQFKIK